jgi:hypothetical protein
MEDRRQLLFSFFIHEAENLHNRVDWFLIFHGILLEAFFASGSLLHHITLGYLGCLVSYVWLVAGIRQLWNITHLARSVSDSRIMGADGELLARLYEARRQHQAPWMKWASSNPAFSAILPFAVLVVWLILTVTENCSWAVLIGIIALLAATTIVWKEIQNWPQPSPEAVAHLADPKVDSPR